MASQCWLLPLLILGTNAIALIPAARQSNQESLKSALDVVARKQRFLDEAETPEYYNELHSFKYHGGDANRKFDRDFDDDDEEFLTEGKVDDHHNESDFVLFMKSDLYRSISLWSQIMDSWKR